MSRVEKNRIAGSKGGTTTASRMTAEQRQDRAASGGKELLARYGANYFRDLRMRAVRKNK